MNIKKVIYEGFFPQVMMLENWNISIRCITLRSAKTTTSGIPIPTTRAISWSAPTVAGSNPPGSFQLNIGFAVLFVGMAAVAHL